MTSDPEIPEGPVQFVARLHQVSLRYGKTLALDSTDLEIPTGCIVGFIGPDGVGKSSLLSLIAGSRVIQTGVVEVLGVNMADNHHRRKVCPRIAYMPQGLGKNLYPTLSVFENVDFFARLFDQSSSLDRNRRIEEVLLATGLALFADRPAGKLSGGMKQKLGLCCALIHDPDLLILDEPTTGIDPLSRRMFWELIERIRIGHPGLSILVATAYMEEAARFDWLVSMNEGRVLSACTPQNLMVKTGANTLEQAFIALLPRFSQTGYQPVRIPPHEVKETTESVIEARQLTMRFGDFTAVDHVNFRIEKGEIFGFVGSNGCGKTTTMKMLTGLLQPSEGEAWLFGRKIDPQDLDIRRRVGYMSQLFSLYIELTVKENLVLHARLFRMPEKLIPGRVQEMAQRFGLSEVMDKHPDALPLGQRQRLSIAVAMIHGPEILILDEPTSGVDPLARDDFWRIMIDLARRDNVTIFISTHLMNEAERCDRISLMHEGKVLATSSPASLMESCNARNLEDAFIIYLSGATGEHEKNSAAETAAPMSSARLAPFRAEETSFFSLRRMFSYTSRESRELWRDPIRLALSLLGSLLLMLAMGYGLNMDVENLTFAVLDRDQTIISQGYTLNLAGSRYFVERPPLKDYEDLDRRMQNNEISLAIEIPPGFARDLKRGAPVSIGAWIDGAMPKRGEIVRGYVQGIHEHWLDTLAREALGRSIIETTKIETRFLYNPDIKSMPAMVPAVIPLLLLMIPSILSALSVVREKELGSIVNLYVTPVTRLEFLLGKQIPYIFMTMGNFFILVIIAVYIFDVPVKGSFLTLTAAALIYACIATSFGLVISSFTNSQVAALFGTAVLTLVPAVQFSGLIDPVSSLEGLGAAIGHIYPTTYFLTITRGTFSKGLEFHNLQVWFIPLLLALPVLLVLGAVLLRKQER